MTYPVPILTDDGSYTLHIPGIDETYHSRRGALGESMHVFINAGLNEAIKRFGNKLNILEVGFGTGLNAFLTLKAAQENNFQINYTGLETNPLSVELISQLRYAENVEDKKLFLQLHQTEINSADNISSCFTFEKRMVSVLDFTDIPERYHLIYFDAFAPRVQPELWTQPVFEKLYPVLKGGGILVTYCSKSIVRKAMMNAGFNVTKPQGPWGKREMVRAEK